MNLCSLVVVGLLLQSSSTGEVDVNAVVCQDASRSFLIAVLAFDTVAVILSVLLKGFWDRRLRWSQSIRLGVSLGLCVIMSTALVAWNPLRDEVLNACIESPEFSRYVLMSHVSTIPRGLVLGGAVSVVLFLLLVIVLSLVSKKR